MKRMISILKKLTVARIINKISRLIYRFIKYDYWELFCSFQQLWKWKLGDNRIKSVLIVELNQFHGEVIVGYAKYFLDQGYDVSLVVRRRHLVEGIFSRIDHDIYKQVVALAPLITSRFLTLQRLVSFDKVFFTSERYIEKFGTYKYVFDYLHWPASVLSQALFVVHEYNSVKNDFDARRLDSTRAFTLSGLSESGRILPMLNPCYFGDVSDRRSGGKRIFITVGSVNEQNRNFDLLLKAVNFLEEDGMVDFEVRVVGKGVLPKLSESTYSRIVHMGYLSFGEMYKAVEEADFFLPLLDPEREEHRRYLSGQTTGSRQLILGFLKPPVIHKAFAEVYGFDDIILSFINQMIWDVLCNEH